MVSIWPWKSDDTSPASFEKILSSISAKIIKENTKLEKLRQRSRRFNVLWILYSSFAYLLYSMILVLVVGWRNWGLVEFGTLICGPVPIYLIRLGLMNYYNYRTTKSQASLDELQAQRDATIEKLKNATKYNTTQELLKKYSGTPSTQKKSLDAPDKRSTFKQDNPKIMKEGRTGLLPPPTANISANLGPVAASNIQRQTSAGSREPLGQFHPMDSTVPGQDPSSPQSENAEFAPNAFSSTLEYAQAGGGPRWYDRLMDVLMGEDEQLPRNRIALICKQCRLVNGQAPPGAKRLEDTGKWRCGGCGTMNGEETEVKKIIESIKDEVNTQNEDFAHDDDVQNISEVEMDGQQISFHADEGEESDITQYSEVSSNRDEVSHPNTAIPEPSPLEDNEPIKRKVGRPKGSKKQRK